ncbi:hypothetical protein [Nodularia sp. UHCC 0506]|uniref:hypothetical protein n=1 Tax=Nodularia sp. UHCC 0506 TaxID=3110243 RepID=UPI002B218C40|nr:hypothetical protein [Nodularia sp. UHCC 0506]MEA5513898.1 hypothetical protein [Nodularia sp. UHCC 0506]
MLGGVGGFTTLVAQLHRWQPTDPYGFWLLLGLAIAQGLQHFVYKFTSSSSSRPDGLLDQIGTHKAIDWQYPIGGSIGIELRRLRRLHFTQLYYAK